MKTPIAFEWHDYSTGHSYWYQLCIFGLNIGFIYKLQ